MFYISLFHFPSREEDLYFSYLSSVDIGHRYIRTSVLSTSSFTFSRSAQSGLKSPTQNEQAFCSSLVKYIHSVHYFTERGRFELPRPFQVCRVSNAVPSTTQPPLHRLKQKNYNIFCLLFKK